MSIRARAVVIVHLISLAGGIGCDGTRDGGTPRAPDRPAIAGALAAVTATEQTHAARAAYYTSEATRYRQIAVTQRQLAAKLAQRKSATPGVAERDAQRGARAEARAADADQIAVRIQPIIDFHTSEAAKEVAP